MHRPVVKFVMPGKRLFQDDYVGIRYAGWLVKAEQLRIGMGDVLRRHNQKDRQRERPLNVSPYGGPPQNQAIQQPGEFS